MITYALATIIAVSWIFKMIAEKEFRISKTPLDIPIALFVSSQLISAIFSMDPHVSWFGYYSRFNGGMWSVITYVFLYYAFVTNFISNANASSSSEVSVKKSKHTQIIPNTRYTIQNTNSSILTFLNIALSTAVIVALYGVAERLGIDKHIWVQDVQNRVFSTLGQPNWLAAYLVALFPLSLAMGLHHLHVKKTLYGLRVAGYFTVSILFFITLLFTRSRSGLFAIALSDILFWLAIFFTHGFTKQLQKIVVIVHLCLFGIVFFNGSNISQIDKHFTLSGLTSQYKNSEKAPLPPTPPKPTGPALESGGTESGTIRKYVWQGAITAWQSSKKAWLIGTGTETFAFAFFQYRPVEHNNTSEWDFLYNKAHNEYLNYLATTGVIGLGMYVVFLGVFVGWFAKKVHGSWLMVHSKRDSINDPSTMNYEQFTIPIALFSGWISILITNFFGFSVVIVQIFLFLFPASIILLSKLNHEYYSFQTPGTTSKWTNWAVGIAGVFLFTRVLFFWYADFLYASGYRDARSGQYGLAKASLQQAIILNGSEPNYHDELSTSLASLALAAYEQQQATVAADLARQALEENALAIKISPQNVNFWKSKTKIYYSFAQLNPAFITEAINALIRAGELSPNDPKIDYNLAILSGRQGNSDKAISYLDSAIAKKPNYRDSYYALFVFFNEMKQPEKAKSTIERYLQTIDASDTQFADLIKAK